MENLALFRLLDAKLDYVSQRQSVLADNIANANTPGFRPREVNEPNFKDIMTGKTSEGGPRMTGLLQTNAAHIPAQAMRIINNGVVKGDNFYEVKPSGNAVDLEEQMLKAGRNQMDANVAINMYVKQLALMRTAIGANA